MPTRCRLVHVVGKRYLAFGDTHQYTIPEEVALAGDFDAARRLTRDTTIHGMGPRNIWSTDDGERHPGDMWLQPCAWMLRDVGTCRDWDDCPGDHLVVMLPTGRHWDIDGRASNCTMPDDRAHRCWVRHGEPPNVTVDKAGCTCGAGAGSIAVPGYHGFLRAGMLT